MKDSSAATGTAVASLGSKDGVTGDEGHLADAEGLAKEAAFLFQGRRFQECVDVLNQLVQKKRDDPKVCGIYLLDCLIVGLDLSEFMFP